MVGSRKLNSEARVQKKCYYENIFLFLITFLFLNLFVLGIGGLGDMRPIYGIIVAEKKGKQGKEGKVRKLLLKIFGFLFINFFGVLLFVTGIY